MSKIFVKLEVFAEIDVSGNNRLSHPERIINLIKINAEAALVEYLNGTISLDFKKSLKRNFLVSSEQHLKNWENWDPSNPDFVAQLNGEIDDLNRIFEIKGVSSRDAISGMNILR
jgi:hypothetical protein